MKKSNKLLLALTIFVFLTIFGSNLVLKAELEKFDFDNIFYGYSQELVPSFKVVKITGNYAGLVQLQPSSDFELRVSEYSKQDVEWEIRGDTLEVFYRSAGSPYNYNINYAFNFSPVLFVMAPELSALYVENCTGKITGFDQSNLITRQSGAKSGILMSDNAFNRIESHVAGGGILKIASENSISKAFVDMQDTSSFELESNIIPSIKIQADSLVHVSVPGSLFNRLARTQLEEE